MLNILKNLLYLIMFLNKKIILNNSIFFKKTQLFHIKITIMILAILVIVTSIYYILVFKGIWLYQNLKSYQLVLIAIFSYL